MYASEHQILIEVEAEEGDRGFRESDLNQVKPLSLWLDFTVVFNSSTHM